MIFLGTPFYGSKVAGWGEVVRRIVDLLWRTDRSTLKSLQIDGENLKDLRFGFADIIRKRNVTSAKIAVFFFFERKATYKVVWFESRLQFSRQTLIDGQWVVREEDASYPRVGEIVPITENHLGICKFDDENDDGYKQVRAKIKQAMEATGTTEANKASVGILPNRA